MTKREKWLLAGPDDISENVQAVAVREICKIVCDKDTPAEIQMAKIRGIINLMAAVNQDLVDALKAEADHD